MATHLDLEEQEQLDQVKHFWRRYGNPITWVLIVVLGSFAAWNGWNWWQRDQSIKAAAIFDELDRAAQAGEADRIVRIFGDLKDRHPRTTYAQQGGLIAASALFEKGRQDDARAALSWVAEQAGQADYQAIARLRLAGLLLDQQQHAEALKLLDGIPAGPFAALAADRRGDVLAAQGQREEAVKAYRKAWDTMAGTVEYRRLVEAKLVALGAPPQPVAVSTGSASAVSTAAASAPASATAASAPASGTAAAPPAASATSSPAPASAASQ